MRSCLPLNSHLCLHEYTNLICIIVQAIPAPTSFSLLKSKARPVNQRHNKMFIPSGVSLFFTSNVLWYEDSLKELLRAISICKMLSSFLRTSYERVTTILSSVNQHICKLAPVTCILFLRSRESLLNLRLIHNGLTQKSEQFLPTAKDCWDVRAG